ncbi:RNA-binding protein 39 isoform X2 [Phymastichus coffea]|nr:RNA-binding protein 39 isoform X2 [Phymastichus coffea]XP_058795620.1 RNA-binding protein 39 isoform X2 [Phymastichus coffea]XP_058795630.1 RNA-binding protein 39 isoform X2 [Phymastichus coffea]
MAEDFDVEAMLEAPYQKGELDISQEKIPKENGSHRKLSKNKHRSRSRSRSRDHRDKERKDRDKDRNKDKTRDRDKDRDRRRRSRSRDRRDRDRDKDLGKDRDKRNKDRDRDRDKRRKRSLTPITLPRVRQTFGKAVSPIRIQSDELTPEERDARTVFCMQLSQRIRARDLEEFFSSVGKVQDVRLITCNKTRRFKGIAYVEFKDPESVTLALGLSGQRLLGVPIVVQHTQAEKNRMGNSMPNLMPKGLSGPMRLYVGSLHFNITEDMLKGIFEPFGKIDNIQLIMDPETGRSKGYGFITFRNSDDAKKALEQLNGFELAGRPMKVGNVTERTDLVQGPSLLDTDDLDRSGIDLGATGRLQLMFKLAEGTGLEIPPAAATALNITPVIQTPQSQQQTAPPIATQCFMLSNMFDPHSEHSTIWVKEIRDDVIEECNKHGGVLHVYVDEASPQGNVYVKCPSIATAVASVNSLHGRWFAGRVITAAYVPVVNYHSLFPDSAAVLQLLTPSIPRKGI